MIDIKVPVFPESITEGTVSKWHKGVGDAVKRDETIVDIETDKVVLEVPAPSNGVLTEIVKDKDSVIKADEVIGRIKETTKVDEKESAEVNKQSKEKPHVEALSPSIRRLISEHNIDVSKLKGSGKDGRILKLDVEKFITSSSSNVEKSEAPAIEYTSAREEKRVPLTRLRARVAERLLGAQRDMAILTTFNEINMQPVVMLRKEHREQFEKTHNVRLGLMSFFVKASIFALKLFPDVNSFIDVTDIVYHSYYDIGIAVATERGLVVPIIRDADQLSVAGLERKIAEYATSAREGKISLEDITGGTFTITNGGVFGSLLSTPIINPPQSAVLGMHKIEDRPVVENGEIVIRPIMYVALSYDHRIIDGHVAVQFLKTIKEHIEDPSRLLLDI